jgi:hypothetical protein
LYGYDPTLHQRKFNNEQEDSLELNAAIPDAAAIEAAKKQRAHRRKIAEWKHSVLIGDNDDDDTGTNTVQFLVTGNRIVYILLVYNTNPTDNR